jgi:CDP-glycerol glycerophosphotransferase (TagB/SpsB family)
VDCPVIYFQFDLEDALRGEHTGRRSYFEYESSGFGPVVSTANEATAMINQLLATGEEAQYSSRRKCTFPNRDFNNSKRVFEAINEYENLIRRDQWEPISTARTGLR